MSSEQAFLDAIRAKPGDDVNRLVYADWLDERDDGRARYLRLEIELARLVESDQRYEGLEKELQSMREGIDPVWLAAAGKPFDLWLLGYLPPVKIRVIKTVRELTGLGLYEAKVLSEKRPSRILDAVPRGRAEEARGQLHGEVQTAIRPALSGKETSPRPALPGYELWLMGYEAEARPLILGSLRALRPMPQSEAESVADQPLPAVLAVLPSEHDANTAALLFEGLAEAEVRPADVPPTGFYPPCGQFEVVLHSFQPEKRAGVLHALGEAARMVRWRDPAHAPFLVNIDGPLPVVVVSGLDWWTAHRAQQPFEGCAEVEVRPMP